MPRLRILKKKEVKQLLEILKSQFCFNKSLDFAFIMTQKEKVYVANKEVFEMDLSQLRLNSLGMYFCEFRNNEVRLSIEGSQIVGPKSSKNIIELDDKQAVDWMNGLDLHMETLEKYQKEFVLIRHNKDFLGSGKVIEDKILNFVPKIRRLHIS